MKSIKPNLYKHLVFALTICIMTVAGCTREKDLLDEEVRQLCAKDGGIKVYETVKLLADRFDKDGAIRIPMKKDMRPEDEYFLSWEVLYYKRGNPELSRDHFKVIRRIDGKVLGEAVYYGRGGGDWPGPWRDSSFSCPSKTSHPSLEESIFTRMEVK